LAPDTRKFSSRPLTRVTIREDAEGEKREVTIGMDSLGSVLIVVYAWRGDGPRLISARKADPEEREQYGINL